MDISTFFTSVALRPVAQNVLAMLFYFSDKEGFPDIDQKTIDKLFYDCMGDSHQKIIRSEKTLERLLKKLRHKKLISEFDDLRKHGVPLAETYFIDQFSTVISERNSERIAPSFIDSCLNKLASHKKLPKLILLNFVDTIEQGYWQLPEYAWKELNVVIAEVRGMQGSSIEKSDDEIDEISLETLIPEDEVHEDLSESPVLLLPEAQPAADQHQVEIPETAQADDEKQATAEIEEEDSELSHLLEAELDDVAAIDGASDPLPEHSHSGLQEDLPSGNDQDQSAAEDSEVHAVDMSDGPEDNPPAADTAAPKSELAAFYDEEAAALAGNAESELSKDADSGSVNENPEQADEQHQEAATGQEEAAATQNTDVDEAPDIDEGDAAESEPIILGPATTPVADSDDYKPQPEATEARHKDAADHPASKNEQEEKAEPATSTDRDVTVKYSDYTKIAQESVALEKEMVRDIGDELMEATNALLDATVHEQGDFLPEEQPLIDEASEDEAITAELIEETDEEVAGDDAFDPLSGEPADEVEPEPEDLVASYEAINLGSFLSNGQLDSNGRKNRPVDEDRALAVVDPLQYWVDRNFAIPVRGLRHLEQHLQKANILYMTGSTGCGKSTLLDGFLHGLTTTGMVPAERIFHLSFRPAGNNAQLFASQLKSFFTALGLETLERDNSNALLQLMIKSNAVFVLDQLHNLRDPDLVELLNNICERAELSEKFGGKIVLAGRERIEDFVLPEQSYLPYDGLSVAESAALMRDLWKLDFPPPIARSLARKLKGNPEFMLFVRNWWIAERRTDTGLQRFLEAMPEEDDLLRTYLLDHLFDTFETVDSRINGFLKAASLFRVPESEYFLECVYDKIGGGDFQQQLEKQVETFGFVTYQEEANRYALPDPLRQYYATRLKDSSEKRMLNFVAGQLYSRRYEKSHDITDAVEGAYHFLDAEREELAALLLRPIMPEHHENEILSSQILDILNELNFEAFQDNDLRAYTLFNRGKLHLEAGEIELADADLLACESLEPPESLKGAVYYSRGEIAVARDDKEEALQLYMHSLSCYEASGIKSGIATASRVLGETYQILGDSQQAVEMYRRALEEYESIGENQAAMSTALSLGLLFKDKQALAEALLCFEKALIYAEKLQDNYQVAELLEHIGQIHTRENSWDDATEVYQKVLQVKRKLNDWDGAAAACEQIGNIHLYLGRWELAINNYENAERLFERSANQEGLATIYNRIGGVHQGRNSWEEAMTYFFRARDIFQVINHKEGIINSLNSIGAVYASRKEWDEALQVYRKSLKMRSETRDDVGIADIQERMGVILREQSHLEEAMSMFNQTLQVREAHRDIVGMAHIHVNIGDVFRADDNPEEAIRLYKQALTTYQKVNHLRGLATVQRGLGACYEKLRDLAPSADAYRKAVDYYTRLRDSFGLVNALYALGNVCHDMGLWQEALGHYHDALPLYEDIGDLQGVARTIGNISSIEFEIEKFDRAIKRQVQILLYFQETGNHELVEKVLANLVACHQDLGAEVFQPVLNECLETTSNQGVMWGKHRIITAEKAETLIQQIFFDA